MATEFTEESVKQFLISRGGKAKNVELVTYFKKFLNDPDRKDEMRDKFKNYVNTLATIKMDGNKEKLLVLKKKYLTDSGGGNPEHRAHSEPPGNSDDRPDGISSSRLRKSDDNLSTSDLGQSTSTLASTGDSVSLGSAISSSSLSSFGADDDVNASVLSVKERAKHLNRIESESEIQKMSSSNLAAVRKKEHRKARDPEGDDSSSGSGGYSPLSKLEKEWLVKCSSSEYHLMNELLSKNPQLVTVKEFTSTALHWAAKKGKPEVVKMLMSKPGINVNQRTGYTPLHLAAIQGHEEIIQLLVATFKADPNIRDYSGKKAKQYLRNSASTRSQRDRFLQTRSQSDPTDKLLECLDKAELLVSSRLSSKSTNERNDGFMRNSGSRRSNRESAIKSLIRASTGAMKQTVIRSGWGSAEDVDNEESTTRSSPRHSAEPSPVIQRRRRSFREQDRNLMPPPGAPTRHSKYKNQQVSKSKESLHSDDRPPSAIRQVSRSESEPNLGEATQVSKQTFI